VPKKRSWVFADAHHLPRAMFSSGMYARVDETRGYLFTHSEGGVEVLYTIRSPSPLSIYQILKYPVGSFRTGLIEDEEPVVISDRRANNHSRAARWLGLLIPYAIRQELIKKSFTHCVPDKVYESVTHRSILVVYGVHRFTFFRGDRESEISPREPRYDMLSAPPVPPMVIDGRKLLQKDILRLHQPARAWASRYATLLPRPADKEHIARRRVERAMQKELPLN